MLFLQSIWNVNMETREQLSFFKHETVSYVQNISSYSLFYYSKLPDFVANAVGFYCIQNLLNVFNGVMHFASLLYLDTRQLDV